MNPMYYGTLMFLAFVTPIIAIGLWASSGLRRSAAAKSARSTATAAPEARSRSVE